MIRVRFHLGAGEHFRHWQVRQPGSPPAYFDPAQVSLMLLGCRLVVRPGAAARVHAAGVKDVCGWVECDEVVVMPPTVCEGLAARFNPIDDVHWYVDDQVADGLSVPTLVSVGRKLISPKCPPQDAVSTEPWATKSCG